MLLPFLNGAMERLAGVLALRWDPQRASGDLMWAHTTRTMCYGYMCTGGSSPKFGRSEMPDTATAGSKVLVGGVPIRFPRLKEEEL